MWFSTEVGGKGRGDMSDVIHSEKHLGYTIEVYADSDSLNPRTDLDNLGRMICFHRRYTLGDRHDFSAGNYSSWDENEAEIGKELGAVLILPIYMYDHGGITISTSPFSCPWDSGRVGTIYATKDDILEAFGKKKLTKELLAKAEKILEGEVAVYDQYLRGEVYGYTIRDEDGLVVDACGGYYGDYDEDGGALVEAKAAVMGILNQEFQAGMRASLRLTGMEE
jgi:hypothetical protein